MITDEMIEKAAQSDADFDGRTWMAMGRGERDRYRARAKALLGLVGPMLVAAERARIRSAVNAWEARQIGLVERTADSAAPAIAVYTHMAAAANDIARTCIEPMVAE